MRGRLRCKLRGLLCRHFWVFMRNVQAGESMYSLWYCPHCGRMTLKREPWESGSRI